LRAEMCASFAAAIEGLTACVVSIAGSIALIVVAAVPEETIPHYFGL
jgi:hypothetical protein